MRGRNPRETPAVNSYMERERTSKAAFFALLLSAMAWALSGCPLFSAEIGVAVVIPAPPPHWRAVFPDLRFSLLFADGDGRFQRKADVDCASPVTIACSKSSNSPVLAYPWSPSDRSCAEPGMLRPAGGIFPGDLRQSAEGLELVLSWEDGAAAEVFRSLLELGVDAELINGERLAGRMGSAADPWAWDVNSVAESLAAGHFNAYDLDLLPRSDVGLRVGAGEWILESPFRQPGIADAEGTLLLPGLGYGLHHIFSRGARIDVYLDARGAASVRY
jgi:hypothetical protein